MDTKSFEIDEEMSKIFDVKVGNPQNSTSIKSANLSQPWKLAFFQDYIFKKYAKEPKPKSTKGENRPYLTVKRAQKQPDNS